MNAAWQPERLRSWIEQSLRSRENILATSNQGTILLCQDRSLCPDGQHEIIVKTAMGSGLLLKARRNTLQREYRAYQKLNGVEGVPACFGMLDGQYLLLEFIRGTPYRDADWAERDRWFAELLTTLQAIHARGVSHGDLKSKGNLMVGEGERPVIVDFGTSFIHKDGFHPINNWLFRTAKRMDLNAWVKHKYHGYYSRASEEDRALLDYSWPELLVRKLSGRPMDRVK